MFTVVYQSSYSSLTVRATDAVGPSAPHLEALQATLGERKNGGRLHDGSLSNQQRLEGPLRTLAACCAAIDFGCFSLY